MILPGSQFDIQPGVVHFTTASSVSSASQAVIKSPLVVRQFTPRNVHARLGRLVDKIDDHQPAFILLRPAPGQKVSAALVVGPAADFTALPFAVAKGIILNNRQQAAIES